jgi:hypothetical protein
MAYDSSRFQRYMRFRSEILNRFRSYDLPIIELLKENSKEAVCLVFEKVNTGGVSLSVFELVTASYAADGFNLRDDWYGSTERNMRSRKQRMTVKPLLKGIGSTDFLQGISLLYTYDRRKNDMKAGRTGKEVTAVSAKREQILAMPLSAYKAWADKLTAGFLAAEQFLRMEGFQKIEFLPYQSQLIPLAVVMVHLGERWLEPVIKGKLTRWYWCGVFGELYGGSTETRIALDVQDLLAWLLRPNAPEPATVIAAGFQPSRLDTLRTRTSAAYRGIYTLLQREGSKDFYWKARMLDLDANEYNIDIHHIFPQAWCRDHKIPSQVYNAIVNKTPISYKANRMIGRKAPSDYLVQMRDHSNVQISRDQQCEILETHLIDIATLEQDDFDSFYQRRKERLMRLIEQAMGKSVITASAEAPVEDEEELVGEVAE